MPSATIRQRIDRLLALADVAINGDRPWDLRVHDDRFCSRVMAHGALGLGESYMDGWWDCDKLDEFFFQILLTDLDKKVRPWLDALRVLEAKVLNLQNPMRAFRIGRHHYDIGNDLFSRMLDKRMIYSCGYWRHATTLDEAQEAKLDLACRKLELRPGMRLLDIGCGWGGTAMYAAERYGVSVLGITVSEQQAMYARELCEGLDVEIRLQDYRDLDGKFDRVVSIGMFEIEDWHNFGADYDRTLMHWHRNFELHWPELCGRYGERFRRMWRCYLNSFAGSFRARKIQLWQLVLSPSGVVGGYVAPR
jgi:cyclopropane-fatty-acyl-phospholipid synthase